MVIYLGCPLPDTSSGLPGADGPPYAHCLTLLWMGFTYALPVAREAVVSCAALPPLPVQRPAVYFCCTFPGVASAGRYPASCPVKPGLSSPALCAAATIRPARAKDYHRHGRNSSPAAHLEYIEFQIIRLIRRPEYGVIGRLCPEFHLTETFMCAL